MVKIARGPKHHARMVTSVSKNAKKGPKNAEKSHNLKLYLVFLKKNLPWLI